MQYPDINVNEKVEGLKHKGDACFAKFKNQLILLTALIENYKLIQAGFQKWIGLLLKMKICLVFNGNSRDYLKF